MAKSDFSCNKSLGFLLLVYGLACRPAWWMAVEDDVDGPADDNVGGQRQVR